MAWPIVGAWVVGLGAQVMAFLLGRARDRGEGHLSLARLGAGYVGNVVLGGLGETGEPRPPMYAAMRLLVAHSVSRGPRAGLHCLATFTPPMARFVHAGP